MAKSERVNKRHKPITSRTNSGGARGFQSLGLSGMGAGLSFKKNTRTVWGAI